MEGKIKVYISSFEGISALDYVDTKSMGHPCVTSRDSGDLFTEYKHLPKGSLNGYLTENQIKAVDLVDKFCEQKGLEYEVVDISHLSFIAKMKILFKRIKSPTIVFRGKRIEGVPTKEDLEALI